MLMRSKFRRNRPALLDGRASEGGYMLLTVLLFITLLVIASAAVAPRVKMQVERDREEELIHRGVQYSRAIKRFYKKFGRYPNSLEELENTNNMRFLRRRYKDPITGKDFKLLRFGDVRMFAQGIPVPGIANGPGVPGQVNPQFTFGGQASVFGQPGNGAPASVIVPGGPGNPGGPGGPTNPALTPGDATAGTAGTPTQPPSGGAVDAAQSQSPAGAGFGAQVFGGGPLVGVASFSPKATIREFNKKKHYKDWQFVYDPSLDRGGMLTGPAQPPLNGGVNGAVGVVAPQNRPGAPGPNQPQQQAPVPGMFPQQPPDIPPQ
jgi:type II secretory pathway pseudopilin PulG